MDFSRQRVAPLFASIMTLLSCTSPEREPPSTPQLPSGGVAGVLADSGTGGTESAPTAGQAAGTEGGSSSSAAGNAPGGEEASVGALAGSAGEAADAPPAMLELSGDITDVHDPQVVEAEGVYYMFSTGPGVQVRVSSDLHSWTKAGQVFATKPAWITTTDPNQPNQLWAPEVAFFSGEFHLYYAASRFGSQSSCIGHATRARLSDGAGWVDSGQPVICTNAASNYNAIDPHPVVDEQGEIWLALGSFWSGLKLIALDTVGSRANNDIYALATRPNTAVEAPYIVYRNGFYYLFESVDACCQGSASTYKIMVGRSPNITGPYADREGTALASDGGTLVLQGEGRWRGPGHNAVLRTNGRDYNVYHSYDADHGGVPTLRIAELGWSIDGWPESAGP